MKMTGFWDVVLCSLVEVYRRFRGAYYLHHQGLMTEASISAQHSRNVMWMHLAYDGDQLWALVITVIDFWIP
jgi:hypothetical protein